MYIYLRNRPSEFNGVNSHAQGLRCAYWGSTSTGAWQQFRPDALPAAANDSYGYQQWLNPGSLGASVTP